MRLVLLSVLMANSLLGAASVATAATFTAQPIEVLGSLEVSATGINDAGTIIGLVTTQSGTSGFIQQANTLTLLNGDDPTAINSKGSVTGIGSNGMGFLWENGAIVQGVSFPLGYFNQGRLAPVLNRNDELAYSSVVGQDQLAYAGRPGYRHFHALHDLSNTTAIVQSINNHGVIAGYERATVNGSPALVVFFGKDRQFDLLLSPYSQSAIGGFINNAGQVAYADGTHGFVYGNGSTISFAPPVTSYDFYVQAINDHGRVVGTYTDSSQSPAVQRAFLFNGSSFSSFGSYPASDVITVALNNHGVMLVSDASSSEPVDAVIVHCHGDGC